MSQHVFWSSYSATITGAIWKKNKPYEDVSDIKSTSTKFQDLWAEFDANKYTPTTPISKIMEFITCLVKKKNE